jgi:hypothetical protein
MIFNQSLRTCQNMHEKLVRSSVDQDAVNEDLTYMQKDLSSAGLRSCNAGEKLGSPTSSS